VDPTTPRTGWRRYSLLGAAAATALAVPFTLAWPSAAAVRPARVVTVSSVSGLQSAVAQAQPGDTIQVADGTYTTSGPIRLSRSGTATAPITVTAAHVGKAVIRGSDGFAFGGAFVVVQGFQLLHGRGIVIPASAHHVKFSRNLVQISRGSTQYWLTVNADDVEIDHNTFQHKSTIGTFIEVEGPGTSAMAQRTWIHHNYFFDHSFRGGNGGESIRVGLSGRQHGSAKAIVEYNLFERCNGDLEVISVKSTDDIIRYNTLLNSNGTITLRHGNHNLVDGNLLIGGKTGIRIFGNNHTVVNNVVQNSTIGSQAIEVGAGEIRDDTKSTTAHDAADHVLVAFNTVVGRGTLIGFGGGKRFSPTDDTIADNVLVGSGGSAVHMTGSNHHFQGNIVWGASGGMPSSGFRTVNPNLVQDGSGLFRPRAGSPAIDAAQGSYPMVVQDVDIQTRSGAKDVGADEFVASGTNRRPLTTADVGPLAA
jgi:poly(beta-D-mannuronate) lyase